LIKSDWDEFLRGSCLNNKYSLFSEKFKNVFALTGGIGCGKSTVLSLFGKIGCYVIDSDKICHSLYTKRNFANSLIKRWGTLIVTEGKINREKVATIVFKNNTELEWLNNMVHPEVFKYATETIENCKKEIVLFDIPLLFELKLENFFKATLAVWTNMKKQYERLKIKNNWSDQEIESRLGAQLSPGIKLEKAVYGIINTGSLDFLEIQCKKIFFKIKEEVK
jgi:dephospho-CoA kinase